MNEAQAGPPGDPARTTLQLVALGALLVTSFWIVKPFLFAALWAAMIAIATWPILLRGQAAFGGRRAPAVALLTILLLLVLVVPLYLGIRAIVQHAEDVAGLSQSIASWSVPQPPAWLEGVPLVGARVASEWRELAAESPEALANRLTPYARDFARFLVAQLGGLGALLLHFLLTVIFTAILYASGESAARGAERFALRLAGEPGRKAARLAAQAVRAVALGVVVTAVVQTALVGLGLAVIGLPFAAILTALAFVLSVAQIGPAPILIGAVVWVYSAHGGVWGTGFLVWALLCAVLDNVVRPVLIKRGADLPLLLVFVGVVGGLVAFGVVGLFIGPVVLAVGYMLLEDWMSRGDEAQPLGGA